MKTLTLILSVTFLGANLFSQKPAVTWGEEFKLRKGSTDLEVLYADNSGVYLQESHLALKSYFVIGATTRASATLVKLDKNFLEVFNNDFNRELKGKEFIQFFILQKKVYLIASEYSKKDAAYTIYAAEVNRESGELAGTWQQLANVEKDQKKDDVDFRLVYNADSTRMVIVSSVQGKEKNTYSVQEFDESMKPSTKAVVISNEFDPKTFQLEDVLYTINKRIILVGRIYEYQEGKKKKNKFLEFANYTIRLYDQTGQQIKELNTQIEGKWITSAKLLQERDKDLILAAFYSNGRKDKTIDGLLAQRINPVTGEVIFTSDKKIDNSMLETAAEEATDDDNKDSDDNESRQERKERERLEKIKDEGEAFSTYMKFRNIYYSPDGGLILLAEKYHHYTYSTQSYMGGSNSMPGQWTTTVYSVHECGDLLMCKINADKNIGWLKVLPKAQKEIIPVGSNTNQTGFLFYGFFDPTNRPFYAGFGSMQANDAICIFFNDNSKNAEVLQPGQKVKRTQRFGKSTCFTVTLDEKTGAYTRKPFFSNADNPTAMPRLGSVLNKDMYIVGKDDKVFGKSRVAVAKISVK